MKSWMTVSDLSEYLQLPESKIRSFIKKGQIPFHDNQGFLRFHRNEIDEWMKTPTSIAIPQTEREGKVEDVAASEGEKNMIHEISYRGRIMNDYVLTASIIFLSVKAWKRIPDFIARTIRGVNETKLREHGREYLYREEMKPFIGNFNDYLRVCCQLGLIDNKQGKGRKKYYYPTEYAERINQEPDRCQEIILESVLNLVGKKLETFPDERHSILLLWYLLTLKEKGIEPSEKHFKLDKDKKNSDFPLIRLDVTRSLREYLFDDRKKEQEFFQQWKRLIT
jgi:excisionase family DNA binding protein